MKGTKIAMAVLAFLSLVAVGGAYTPFFIPLSEHTMAKNVNDCSLPVQRTYSFSTHDEHAVSWLNIWKDGKPHSVEWRWYYPQGGVYSRSFDVIPSIDGFIGSWNSPVWACMKIKGCDAERLPGLWKVDVIVDYRKVLTEYFTIGCKEDC
jgi:hypothetical protein